MPPFLGDENQAEQDDNQPEQEDAQPEQEELTVYKQRQCGCLWILYVIGGMTYFCKYSCAEYMQ